MFCLRPRAEALALKGKSRLSLAQLQELFDADMLRHCPREECHNVGRSDGRCGVQRNGKTCNGCFAKGDLVKVRPSSAETAPVTTEAD